MKANEIQAGQSCQVDYNGGVYVGYIVRPSQRNAGDKTRMFDVKLQRNGAIIRCSPRQIHRVAEPTPKAAKGAATVKCAMCPSTEITGLIDMGGTTPDPKPACKLHSDPTLAAPEPAPPPKIGATQVFTHMIRAQRSRTLKAAVQLQEEVQLLVKQLEAGNIPSQSINASTVGFLLTDHAQLLALRDALDVVEKEG